MADPKKSSPDIFDLERIRRLVELMKEHDLNEVDLQQDEQRIKLTRGTAAMPVAMPIPSMPIPSPSSVNNSASMATTSSASSQPAADDDGPHIAYIKSPMVGTFYSKPNPNSKDYASVGSSVQPDTIVCMIEAMKVFNEIPAEVRGKIVAVLVENEEAVDFGKPLFKVDTRG